MKERVTSRTRARRGGTIISCPCGEEVLVFHFAWSALVCTVCQRAIEKTEWRVRG